MDKEYRTPPTIDGTFPRLMGIRRYDTPSRSIGVSPRRVLFSLFPDRSGTTRSVRSTLRSLHSLLRSTCRMGHPEVYWVGFSQRGALVYSLGFTLEGSTRVSCVPRLTQLGLFNGKIQYPQTLRSYLFNSMKVLVLD